MSTENRAKGTVSKAVFAHYASAVGGAPAVLLVLLLFGVQNGATAMGNWWLSYWSSHAESSKHSQKWFLSIYAYFAVGSILVTLLLRLAVAFVGVHGARKLHEGIVQTILRGYMSFFDTTPLGRILNRFSQDQYTVDEKLPGSFASFFNTFFSVMSTVVVISSVTP